MSSGRSMNETNMPPVCARTAAWLARDDGRDGERSDYERGLTFHVPRYMAMQRPHPRIVGDEPDDDVPLRGDGDGVASHGVLEVPGRGVAVHVLAGTPAYYLETMACLIW